MTEKTKEQEKIIKIIQKNNYNGTIVAATGVGKGKIMVEIIKKLKPESVLYCCDNKDLRDTTFKEEVIKWGGEEYLDKIEMQCYQTTYKYENKTYDLLLADEGDFMVTEQYIKTLTNNNFKHTLVFTGTFSDEKLAVIEKLCPVIYTAGIQYAEEKGLVNEAKVFLVNYSLTEEENKKYLAYNTRFANLLADKAKKTPSQIKQIEFIGLQRKRFLSELTSSRLKCRELMKYIYSSDKNCRVLVFCGSTIQADAVCKTSYHSNNSEKKGLERFNEHKTNMLSVVDKVNRGLNLNGVNHIIFETSSRSKTKNNQRTGRGRRLEIGETLNIYYLIPNFITRRGEYKPTVIWDYILQSADDLNLENATILNI